MTSTHLHVNYVLNMRAHAYRDGNTGRFLYLKINALLAIGGLSKLHAYRHLNRLIVSIANDPLGAIVPISYRCFMHTAPVVGTGKCCERKIT